MLTFRQRLSSLRPRSFVPGFAMPLAIGASGVMALLGFTLHGVSIQERLQVGALEQQQRDEDVLHSAAHQLVASLNGAHPCLLSLPLAQWEVAGAACSNPTAVAALKRARVLASSVELVSWTPGGNGQSGQLALQLGAGRQARYGVRPAATPNAGVELGPRILGGTQP